MYTLLFVNATIGFSKNLFLVDLSGCFKSQLRNYRLMITTIQDHYRVACNPCSLLHLVYMYLLKVFYLLLTLTNFNCYLTFLDKDNVKLMLQINETLHIKEQSAYNSLNQNTGLFPLNL